jgi:Integrase core domain
VDKGSRVERQQIKWLAFFAAIMAVGFGIIDAGAWLFLVGIAAFNCFPIGVGIAVVRYRLLDIDVVINRTLVYGILTGILALVYFGGMAASEAVFRALTAQEQQPQIAVVASTLVIAALFTPLRRRIQLDTYSRRIVGWSMANNLKTELVLDALNMAIYNRRPQPGLIHHSDRGGQYTSVEFGSRLKEAGL